MCITDECISSVNISSIVMESIAGRSDIDSFRSITSVDIHQSDHVHSIITAIRFFSSEINQEKRRSGIGESWRINEIKSNRTFLASMGNILAINTIVFSH